MKQPRDHSKDAMYIVHYWRVTGGPMWGGEAASAEACARLTKANRADDPVGRFRVFAVPHDRAGLPLDELIRAAEGGQLERLFIDPNEMRKAGLAP